MVPNATRFLGASAASCSSLMPRYLQTRCITPRSIPESHEACTDFDLEDFSQRNREAEEAFIEMKGKALSRTSGESFNGVLRMLMFGIQQAHEREVAVLRAEKEMLESELSKMVPSQVSDRFTGRSDWQLNGSETPAGADGHASRVRSVVLRGGILSPARKADAGHGDEEHSNQGGSAEENEENSNNVGYSEENEEVATNRRCEQEFKVADYATDGSRPPTCETGEGLAEEGPSVCLVARRTEKQDRRAESCSRYKAELVKGGRAGDAVQKADVVKGGLAVDAIQRAREVEPIPMSPQSADSDSMIQLSEKPSTPVGGIIFAARPPANPQSVGVRTSLDTNPSNREDPGAAINPAMFHLTADKHNLDVEVYDVSIYYHADGLAQRIARSDFFINTTLAVIGLNAVYIGVDADNNDAKVLANAKVGYQIFEHFFFLYFAMEWGVRFLAFANKRDCFRDQWFVFDSVLFLLMFLETWMLGYMLQGGVVNMPTGLIKMMRLLRLTRMVRLMRSLPELIAMLKGVRVASRAVGCALLMLVSLVYIFAIILQTVLAFEKDYILQTPSLQQRLDGLFKIMMTLLIDGTFMDNIGLLSRGFSDFKEPTVRVCSLIVLWLFVLLSALTVMNMLIGVLCEVVSAVAACEKENNAILLVKKTLLVMLKNLDEDRSGSISQDEIVRVFDSEESLAVLSSLDVDVENLLAVLEMYYEKTDGLAINFIIEVILRLRGDRSVSVKDMIHQQRYQMWATEKSLASRTLSADSNQQQHIAGAAGSVQRWQVAKQLVL
eukprot:TRINITY_DN12566_c0_g1_i4.p1 TRINITY_DN12566_c0_g1~~TRINITY_DN12566_c0_g1_i4.p1  ORF type:complete len:781 (-),score=151.63 TRINITY_DN12566_c0_g1_i4:164-2506(-)